MTLAALDATSRPSVGHLLVRKEDEDEFVLGNPATGRFVVVPEAGARLIELLAAGQTVAEVADVLELELGEPVDVVDFVEMLVEAGLLDEREAAGEAAAERVEEAEPGKKVKYWVVSKIPPWVVKPLFGKAAWTFYVGCLVATLAMFATDHSLLPSYEDAFVVTDILLSVMITNVVVMGLAVVHEIWHAFAGAAAGVRSQLRLERRGIFTVLETDLTGLWALPPAKRYSPFLAGMAFDSFVLFAAVAPRFAWSRGWIDLNPNLVRFLAMLVLSQVGKLAFQTMAYLRTDMYLVMATATGCKNLHQVTRLGLKRLIRKLTPLEQRLLREADAKDLRVARWYRLLYLAGIIWMGWFAWTFILPAAKVTLGWASGVMVGAPVFSFYWWEGIALIAFAVVNLTAPLIVALRNRIRARRAAAVVAAEAAAVPA
ncbi:PqqD family protein [Streptomyces sp. SID13031]|uniref:PqqD family protein n=1 Tax=Streptomyces sp. SID13031 TaxID=2706046 RepID=UPI0013C96728|nr:PqqD family protein [Streptomyces sp. SID13031]NEA31188.1 PqqD family protein [Streptomyces sp. SID13031]